MYYLNPSLKNLVRIFDQNERKGYLRLDLNENPGGLPQDFVKEVLAEVTPSMVAQYPETKHSQKLLQNFSILTLSICAWLMVRLRVFVISYRLLRLCMEESLV